MMGRCILFTLRVVLSTDLSFTHNLSFTFSPYRFFCKGFFVRAFFCLLIENYSLQFVVCLHVSDLASETVLIFHLSEGFYNRGGHG